MRKQVKKIPKISIITPTFNQASFIEQTIQSVLSQSFQDFEHIIFDNCSTDGTLEILEKYKKQVTAISEKDKGQSHALNKGLRQASGEIVCYINSDDYLEKDALSQVASFFAENPRAMWVTGKCNVVDENNRNVRSLATVYKNGFLKYARFFTTFSIVQFVSQPATFWRRSLIDEIGFFDEQLHYDMDYDYWLRIWKKHPLYFIDEYLASYRVHSDSKAVTSPEKQFLVEHEIAKRHIRSVFLLALHKIHTKLALWFYRLLWVH